MNRLSRRRSSKRKQRYVQYIIPPSSRATQEDDKEEIQLFIALRRFGWLIAEVKKQIYRKPSHPFQPRRKKGRV